MEINWTQIKKEIIAEIQEIISSDSRINLNEMVDLFIKVITFSVENNDLKGIQTRMPNALQKIFVENLSRIDKNAFFPEAGVFEPYLRKVLFLVNNSEYIRICSESKENRLKAIISILNLNPNNVSPSWTSLSQNQSTHFAEHYIKAYNLRNFEAHNCTEWTNSKLYDELRSALVFYIYTTFRYQLELKVAINPFDVSSYLVKEIQKIKVLQSRFVHIEGKEKMAEIDLYAKELFENSNENEDIDDDTQITREGTIDYLRKTVKERKLVILGDVGMGKSTTLLYLHLIDAQESLKNSQKPIPIYIELKNLTEKDILVEKIMSRLNLDSEIAQELLSRGRLNIFLDGLNEIENKIKSSIFKQIGNLINDYPNNFYLITSRPQHYNREFDNQINNLKLPVFILQKMGDKQIIEFLSKNGSQVKEYLLKEINENERLKKIIQTPLMLTMLIAVVLKEGKIPSEKGKIIRAFMISLYDREQKQIIDFDIDLFHLLLCYLGFQTRDLTGSNSGLDRDSIILPLLQSRKEQLGTPVNLLDFLKKAIDLNILVNDNNQFSFSHELYQEYYAAEYLHQLMK